MSYKRIKKKRLKYSCDSLFIFCANHINPRSTRYTRKPKAADWPEDREKEEKKLCFSYGVRVLGIWKEKNRMSLNEESMFVGGAKRGKWTMKENEWMKGITVELEKTKGKRRELCIDWVYNYSSFTAKCRIN